MTAYREKLLEKFSQAYEKLNPAQQQAVDTIEGPVMVIAGPGTGKTQILAARIGKILLETDVYPQNILCLTYTDAGVIAMRRRLTEFIGADAYKVNVFTFHAFCNDVIQENVSLFEKHELNPITDIERSRILREIIDNIPAGNVLKRYKGNLYYDARNLQELFGHMKKEDWSPVFIESHIDEYIEDMANRPNFVYRKKYKDKKPGDFKPAYFAEKERMEKLRAAVHLFPEYVAAMQREGFYDFDDMIIWVLRIFKDHPEVLEHYQEKYQYMLVDEYQDTSGIQNNLVHQLISYWEEPNVFVVGDDDQSIFRFQGANVENMTALDDKYKSLSTVVLEHNYRSAPDILKVAASLINHNSERLIHKMKGLSKNLIAANKNLKDLTLPVKLIAYRTPEEEMAAITLQVAQLIAHGTPPAHIAIINIRNAPGQEMKRYLHSKNIPTWSKRNTDLLSDPFIQKIVTLLEYVAEETEAAYSGDHLLFQIMHFDFFGIPPIEAAKLSVTVSQKKNTKESTSIRQLLTEKEKAVAGTLFEEGSDKLLIRFSRIIEGLMHAVANETLPKFFEHLIRESGILKYILEHTDKILLLQMLTRFFDFIKEECARMPELTLRGLTDLLSSMKVEKITLPFYQVSGSEQGVSLLTAHGSKGLEFEHVFITGMCAGNWEKKRGASKGFKLPDNLFITSTESNSDEELRRLFYVAITRAEKHLQVSYYQWEKDKEQDKSMFVQEIMDGCGIPEQVVALKETDLLQFRLLQFSEDRPVLVHDETDFVKPLVEKYVMNATSLNQYLRCPLAFYYNSLIRIPSGKSENLEFGSAIHFALEYLFAEMLKDAQRNFPPKKAVCDRFAWYMKRHRENFTEAGYRRLMEYGEQILCDYYDEHIHSWKKIVAVERNIRGVVFDGIPLRGKVDKIEFDGNKVNVVDYKTGNPEKDATREQLKPPSEKRPEGGDYWRQAVFYKILIDGMDDKNWEVVSTEFDFVEPAKDGKFINVPIPITPPDLETVRRQIKEVWAKIQAYDFYEGCGKEKCEWCNLVKENGLSVTLPEQVEEADAGNI